MWQALQKQVTWCDKHYNNRWLPCPFSLWSLPQHLEEPSEVSMVAVLQVDFLFLVFKIVLNTFLFFMFKIVFENTCLFFMFEIISKTLLFPLFSEHNMIFVCKILVHLTIIQCFLVSNDSIPQLHSSWWLKDSLCDLQFFKDARNAMIEIFHSLRFFDYIFLWNKVSFQNNFDEIKSPFNGTWQLGSHILEDINF